MGNCLVTKLKGTVDANLPIIGRLNDIYLYLNGRSDLRFYASEPNKVKCTILSDEFSFGNCSGDAVKINDKEVYLPTAENGWVYFNEGSIGNTMHLMIDNYYDIERYYVEGNENVVDFSKIKYMSNLIIFEIRNAYNFIGQLSDLKENSNLDTINIECNHISTLSFGDIYSMDNPHLRILSLRNLQNGQNLELKMLSSTFKNNLEYLDVQSCAVLNMSLSDFYIFSNLQQLNIADQRNLNDTFHGQSLEDFVKGYVAHGKTSGDINLYCVRSNILFNGASADGDGLMSHLTWEPASTSGYTQITWKGVSIVVSNA